MTSSGTQVVPADAARWSDLEQLLGPRGAYLGCWCMWWRLPRKEFKAQRGQGNRESLRDLVCSSAPSGVLAYREGQCVGWCSIAPRPGQVALETSRILRSPDQQDVWAVTCFYVAKTARRTGLTDDLLEAALSYAADRGGRIVEAYPIDLDTPQLAGQRLTGYAGYMGFASTFRDHGFREVGRASETQLIMRCDLT